MTHPDHLAAQTLGSGPAEMAGQTRTPSSPGMDASLELVRSYTGPAMCSPGLSARLAAVEQPTLIVWGADDPVLPPAHGRRLAADLGDATCVVVPGAGHLPHEDTPEQTLAEIRTFLDRTPVAQVQR